jgi:serine/threonine protein kinase
LAFGVELASESGSIRYRIDGLIGQGGFGIAYRGTALGSEPAVVIKEYLPSEFAIRGRDSTTVVVRHTKNKDAFDRGLSNFLKEAQIVRGFDEESIVKVLDVFRANGTAYFVMPFEDSETLAERLERTRTLPEEELRGVFLQLLDGLRVVHDAGYLHRDIKPSNILLRKSDGRPVLIDFGAARQALLERSRSISMVLTPGYAPPEQYTSSSKKQGAWTDLYAIGATMYRCVSGFSEQQMSECSALARKDALQEKLDDPLHPAIQEAAGNYSESLLHTIDWMLRLEVSDRAANVRGVQACLLGTNLPPGLQPETVQPPEPPPPPQPPPEPPLEPDPETPWKFSNWPWRTIAISLLSVTLIAGATYFLFDGPGNSDKSAESDRELRPGTQQQSGNDGAAANGETAETLPGQNDAPPVGTAESPPPPATEETFRLTVRASPRDARVRILNIQPRYEDQIALAPGNYVVEVSRPGYETFKGSVALDRDTTAEVSLCQIVTQTETVQEPYQAVCEQAGTQTVRLEDYSDQSAADLRVGAQSTVCRAGDKAIRSSLTDDCRSRGGRPGLYDRSDCDCETIRDYSRPVPWDVIDIQCTITGSMSCDAVPGTVSVPCTQSRPVSRSQDIVDPLCPTPTLSIR